MKKNILSAFCLAISLQLLAQSSNSYNKNLADSLGSDDYGMKMYILVVLKTGSASFDKKTTDSLFDGHMTNMGRLAREGKLIVAGPLKKNDKNYRGIFIFNVKTIEEAKELLLTDAAVKANVLDTELYQWYGSAALPMYLPYHSKVQKKQMW